MVKTPTVRYRNCNAKGFERLGYLFSRKFGLWLRLCCLVYTKREGEGGERERKERVLDCAAWREGGREGKGCEGVREEDDTVCVLSRSCEEA